MTAKNFPARLAGSPHQSGVLPKPWKRPAIKAMVMTWLFAIGFSLVGIFPADLHTHLLADPPNKNASETPKYSFETQFAADELHRVQATIKVEGNLKLNARGKEITEVPLKVNGTLHYDERIIEDSTGKNTTRRSVRAYHQAQANIEMKTGKFDTELDPGHRLIVAQFGSGAITLYSPQGPLSRDALELLEVQGDPLLFPSLLPMDEIAVGEEWTPDLRVMAPMFGWEAISKNEAQGKLLQVEGDLAVLEIGGKVTGHVGGVPARVRFKARYHYQLSTNRVSGFSMAVHEDRSIGHAEPGFSIKTQLQSSVTPLEKSPALDPSALAPWNLEEQKPAAMMLQLSSTHGYRLLHDRSWRVMVDRPDVTIMRCVRKGDLVAQCNITHLDPLPAGKQLPLEEFQADIQQTLKENFSQFVEASQSTTEADLRVLRVTAAGVTKKLPIQWIYYHLSDASGRRAALVFTMEQKLVEKFAGADGTIVGSFEFRDDPAPRAARSK